MRDTAGLKLIVMLVRLRNEPRPNVRRSNGSAGGWGKHRLFLQK